MDIARGQSGPYLPGRTGTAAQEAVRHRIGRPAGRVRAGRAGRPDRTATRPWPGEAPLRGGLVHPSAAARLADLRRARRGAAGRAARAARRRAGPPGQGGVGGAGVRRAGRLGHPAAAHPGHPQGTGTARAGPRPGALVRAGRGGRPPGHRARTHPARLRDHRRRRRRPEGRAEPRGADRVRRALGAPAPHRWAERDPAAAARLARCREVVNRLATTHAVPPENLLAPDAVRRLAWAPPEPAVDRRLADPAQVPARDVAAVWAALKEYGARLWQIELTATELTEALAPPAITHE